MAFSSSPIAFDLSVKLFDEQPQAARQVTLMPPPAGAGFTVLPHTLPGFQIAATSWTDASCGCDRGLLVLRTTVRKKDKQALVARLAGRRPTDPTPPAEIEGVSVPGGALIGPAPVVVPALRLFGVTRQGPAVLPGSVAINTLVRFDPRRPSEPADELETDRKNEALKGKARDRIREFGQARPFRVEWDLKATHDDTGAPAPIVTSGLGIGSEVGVVSFPGPAASAFLVNGQDLARALTAERTLVSIGQLMIRVPPGVTVIGEGRIHYEGSVPLGLSIPVARVVFRIPRRQYAREWDLVSELLAEIDPATSAARLRALKADACTPVGPAKADPPAAPEDCALMPLSAEMAAALGDPVRRWSALRELHTGRRPFARFLRLFARALVWDREVADDERQALKRLLQVVETEADAASADHSRGGIHVTWPKADEPRGEK